MFADDQENGSTSAVSYSKYIDKMTAATIRDRIRRRRPNPGSRLTTRRATALRFGERCQRGPHKPAKWHDIDYASNRHGKRSLVVLDDGSEYTGEWEDNLRHGHGTHYTSVGFYTGDFVDDRYEGNGEFYLWHKETNCEQDGLWLLYTGEWADGRYHGNGILYYTDYGVYQGEFYKGMRCGQGTMCYPNKDTYTGSWVNDIRQGFGEYTKENGDVFEGKYENDMKNGEGVLHIVKSKRRLQGVWVDDMMKTGAYYDEDENPKYVQPDDISGTTDGMIPPIEVKDSEDVLKNAINDIQTNKK